MQCLALFALHRILNICANLLTRAEIIIFVVIGHIMQTQAHCNTHITPTVLTSRCIIWVKLWSGASIRRFKDSILKGIFQECCDDRWESNREVLKSCGFDQNTFDCAGYKIICKERGFLSSRALSVVEFGANLLWNLNHK